MMGELAANSLLSAFISVYPWFCFPMWANTMNASTTAIEWMEPASPEALLPDHGWEPWLAVAAATVLVLILLRVMLRKKTPLAVGPLARRNAAFAEAVAALAAATRDDVRATAVQSSLILRKYLAVAADDPALFETHEEFVLRHDALPSLSAAARSALAAGLSRLAAMKYSPASPDESAAGVIAQSRALLETLHHGFTA